MARVELPCMWKGCRESAARGKRVCLAHAREVTTASAKLSKFLGQAPSALGYGLLTNVLYEVLQDLAAKGWSIDAWQTLFGPSVSDYRSKYRRGVQALERRLGAHPEATEAVRKLIVQRIVSGADAAPKGPKVQKRPANVVSNATKVARIATAAEGEAMPAKSEAAATLGKPSGPARAKSLTAKKRSAIAKKAAATRWAKQATPQK